MFLLAQPASAYTYLNIYIEENGEAVFLGETDESPILPEGVSLENGIIRGATQSLTSKQGLTWTFSYFLQGSELNIILPEGAVVKSITRGEISIDDNQISIFVNEGTDMQYIISQEEKQKNIFLILGIIIILLIISIIFYFKFYTKKKKPKIKEQNKLDIIKQVLSEREKLILDKLKLAGKIKSSHLRRLTELPKASFSRHIHELEKKSLIKRSGEGRNKFVELK